MTGMRFVDTNILLYSISTLAGEASKARVARDLLRERDLALSVQVLQEFYVQATRPARVDRLSHEEAVAFIGKWKRYPISEVSLELVERALLAKVRWGVSYWDAAIMEAARIMSCEEVLTEDLADGQDYGGVRVVNPFGG